MRKSKIRKATTAAQRLLVMLLGSAPLPDDLGIPAERRIELSANVDYSTHLIRNELSPTVHRGPVRYQVRFGVRPL
jgi:hypothetical protein